jgi:hypothetical protein
VSREPARGPTSSLNRLQRLLLWDYDRGSPAYDVVVLLLVLLLLLVPAGFWGDPMMVPR